MTLDSNGLESSPLPIGWKWAKLGDVAQYTNGRVFHSSEWSTVGLPIIRIQNLNNTNAEFNYFDGNVSASHYVEAGDLLVSWSASLDVYFWDRLPGALNQHIFKVQENPSVIDKDFLFFALKFVMKSLRGMTQGATMTHVTRKVFESTAVPLPPLKEQKRIAAILNEQMGAVEKAKKAAEERLEAAEALQEVYIRESLEESVTEKLKLADCLDEIKTGVGQDFDKYQVYGATIHGLAPAKYTVGDNLQYKLRYKMLEPGTVFYNPMRIMIGSVAVVEEDVPTGITSPDYVVVKGKSGVLDWRWFYYWMRSPYGKSMIQATSRGAVRERILFNRLKNAVIEIPDWETQLRASEKLRGLRKLIEVSTKILPDIDALQSPLLRRAFSGEL